MGGASALALAATPVALALGQVAQSGVGQGNAGQGNSGPANAWLGDAAHGTAYDADRKPARGIPGVMVSNGQKVVKTDADGAWSLPVRPGIRCS